ncbi:hypothetical protein [Terricaulis sp.]|uniref:hypothetical protein n=1 Tax=Terricaulis sp. TaxID=2768686 RepID=UPI003784A8D2
MTALSYVLQYLHIVCAAFWIGSLLYTELILWPRLRAIGELARIQTALRDVRMRKIMGVFIVGTIVTGFARGLTGGVLDRLFTPYGVLFIGGAIFAVFMMTWWLAFPPRSLKMGWRLFYASFWIVLAFMIGMRFAA